MVLDLEASRTNVKGLIKKMLNHESRLLDWALALPKIILSY